MNRRRLLLASGTGFAILSGCTGDGSTDENNEDVDTGVIVEEELSALWEEFVNVRTDQRITVEANGIGDGEELQFQVGDGTAFVHTEHLYEDGTDSYVFESDGRHQIQFHPKRHEAPMNEDVTVSVRAEITD